MEYCFGTLENNSNRKCYVNLTVFVEVLELTYEYSFFGNLFKFVQTLVIKFGK